MGQFRKPPLGVMPKWLWLEKRRDDLIDCIQRHIDEHYPISNNLIQEYNFVLDELSKVYPTYANGTWGKS